MINTKLFLLIGTSLSLISGISSAQCVATQDCATLGYTETSCSGGNGVKCPFGNKWACFKSEAEIEAQFCDKYGYTHTCTGTNQTGGAGNSCNGKYSECACAAGYIWNTSSQTCEAQYAKCVFGALYYADGTCSNDYLVYEKLIGIVIYPKTASESGWVLALKPIKSDIAWSHDFVDIPELPNYTSTPTDIQASCTNTDIITAHGTSYQYPAAWAAKNYTEGGKTWCLPSAGLLHSVLNTLNDSNNLTKFNDVITTIRKAAGNNTATPLGKSSEEYIWSSSEFSHDRAWFFRIENTSGYIDYGNWYPNNQDNKDTEYNSFTIRPVFAF